MQKQNRLVFIDAIRAFAIVMMLQGHFIDGLLAPTERDMNNIIFSTWLYFRGITAPVFFSITGFIFVYLMLKKSSPSQKGIKNPRIKKGIKRGLLLIVVGYVLRFNFENFIYLNSDPNATLVDVLHCIGASLILLCGIYVLTSTFKHYRSVFGSVLFLSGILLFLGEPFYKGIHLSTYPKPIANYFTQHYGSVFTLFPWFGYVALGGVLATLFCKFEHKKKFYTYLITTCLLIGCVLLFILPTLWCILHHYTGNFYFLELSKGALLLRLGNVLIVFSFFTLLRNFITAEFIQKIGQNTLVIYIIHYFILYGSLTGHGLYRYYHHSLLRVETFLGVILFIAVVLALSQSFIGRFLNKFL